MSNHVSVVIPNFNRMELIQETLNSLRPEYHSGVELEVIVVDDGSTDGGDLLIEKNYPWVKLEKQSKKGAPAARNNGLSLATGKYVLFLDSDDLVEKGFFLKKVSVLDERVEVSGVYGPWDHFDSETRKIIPRFKPYPLEGELSGRHLERLLSGWYINPNAILWRLEIIKRLGGYKEGLLVNQDVELLFRMLSSGQKILGVESPRALYREHRGDRVGTVKSAEKLACILHLRKEFYGVLKEKHLWNESHAKSLGTFLFYTWAEYQDHFPKLSVEFLTFSREIYPRLRLRGRVLLQMLDITFGPVNAIKIRNRIMGCLNKLQSFNVRHFFNC